MKIIIQVLPRANKKIISLHHAFLSFLVPSSPLQPHPDTEGDTGLEIEMNEFVLHKKIKDTEGRNLKELQTARYGSIYP